CFATGVAGTGQYANIAEVTAVDGYGTEVSDDDPSHYFGEEASIAIVKYTNGDDANAIPGPLLAEGDDVTWTNEVTNAGNTPPSPMSPWSTMRARRPIPPTTSTPPSSEATPTATASS